MSFVSRSVEALIKPIPGNQVRYASKKPNKVINQTTKMRSDLRRFLGPRNFKGFHKKNPFFFPSSGHKSNYITQYPVRPTHMFDRGKIDWMRVFQDAKDPEAVVRKNAQVVPFPNNSLTQTNRIVPQRMKREIVELINGEKGEAMSAQEVSRLFSIAVPRIEAIVALDAIKKKWESENKITRDMKRMARVIEGMLPEIIVDRRTKEILTMASDLSEIPVLEETRSQRFITIAESEPFGPVDAARVLGIEPASKLLDNLNSSEDHHKHDESSPDAPQQKRGPKEFIAPQLEQERVAFRFKSVKVGDVGFRYGASRDDQKHNRKVVYNVVGQKQYAF